MIPNQNPRVHACAVIRKPPKPDDQLYFSTGQSKNSESGASVFQFESLNEIQVDHDSRATATLETKTELSKDARAIRERVLKCAEEDLKGKTLNTGDAKLYKRDSWIHRLQGWIPERVNCCRWKCGSVSRPALPASQGFCLHSSNVENWSSARHIRGFTQVFAWPLMGICYILTGGASSVDIKHENRPTLITRIRWLRCAISRACFIARFWSKMRCVYDYMLLFETIWCIDMNVNRWNLDLIAA